MFFQGSIGNLPVPMGVAEDLTCGCDAVSSIFGGGPDNAVVEWFTAAGEPVNRPGVPGESLSDFGNDPTGFDPFGMGFAPDGTLYFIDIHIVCSGSFSNCGPQDFHGRLMRVRFDGLDRHQGPESVRPGNPLDTTVQDPSYFAIDATTGEVLWDASSAQAFGATPDAGGLLFTGLLFKDGVTVRDAVTGTVVATLPLPNWSWSGVAVSGNTVVVGVGTAASGSPAGVVAFVPGTASRTK